MKRAARKLFLVPLTALLAALGVTFALSVSPAHAAVWQSCEQWGNWTDPDGYIVYNNIWGSGAGSQCIEADSHASWTVTADHPNTGGIKSYPNAKYIVDAPLDQITSLTSTHRESVPSAGAYNTAYDIWDTDYDHEVMIWENWFGPVGPLGSPEGQFTIGGASYDVYRGSNGHNMVYSFLRTSQRTSGTVDLLAVLDWIAGRGWISQSEQIGDVQFGYEITSASGGLRFSTLDFSVSEGTGSTSGGSTSGGSTSGGSGSGGSGGSGSGGGSGGNGDCSAAYRNTNDWGSGFTGEITVSCSGSSLNGWTVSWDWPSGQQLGQSWGADCTQSGTRVTCTNAGWNASVPDGGSVAFGFLAGYSGSNSDPTALTVS